MRIDREIFRKEIPVTPKELRKMSRFQLLELLVFQTERADKLQKEIEDLQAQLQDRNLRLSKLGSIAEASLHLSGIFDAAQEAADFYITAAKKRAWQIEEEAKHRAKFLPESQDETDIDENQ